MLFRISRRKSGALCGSTDQYTSQLLVQAGLTPIEALRTATYNPAMYLGMLDSLGTVEKGKIADLVLLEANPLDDINNARRINAVILDGRYFSKEALTKLLAEAEAAAN